MLEGNNVDMGEQLLREFESNAINVREERYKLRVKLVVGALSHRACRWGGAGGRKRQGAGLG